MRKCFTETITEVQSPLTSYPIHLLITGVRKEEIARGTAPVGLQILTSRIIREIFKKFKVDG